RAEERPAVPLALGRGDPPRSLAAAAHLAAEGDAARLAGHCAPRRPPGSGAPVQRRAGIMSRTVRATIAALFGYARFVAAFAIGLALVPFILHHLGATMYGYWLASGELMAYAALAEFGVLVTLPWAIDAGGRPRGPQHTPQQGAPPWLIAEADGRGDRDRIRELVTTGGGAALLSAAVCLLVSVVLWFALPRVLHLAPELRSAVIGQVLVVALLGAVAHPLRVFGC